MKTILNKHPWLLIVVAFTALISAWSVLITLAVKNQPEKIPIEHRVER